MDDPEPGPRLPALKRQFLNLMRWGALFSIAVAAVAVLLVVQSGDEVGLHMMIATALGAGLSVMMGIALMSLVFLSARMGQDADAADHSQREDDDIRP
jgi:hypothetical protein